MIELILTERDRKIAELYVDYVLTISQADRCIALMEELNGTN